MTKNDPLHLFLFGFKSLRCDQDTMSYQGIDDYCDTAGKQKGRKWLWLIWVIGGLICVILLAIAISNIEDPMGIWGLMTAGIIAGVLLIVMVILYIVIAKVRAKKIKTECIDYWQKSGQNPMQSTENPYAPEKEKSWWRKNAERQVQQQVTQDTLKFLGSGLR